MFIAFTRNNLEKQAHTLGEAAGKHGVVHDHPETSRPLGHNLSARQRTAQPPDEVELRTGFVGTVYSRIGRCEFAEGAGRHPQSACSFPGVDGGGIARYLG